MAISLVYFKYYLRKPINHLPTTVKIIPAKKFQDSVTQMEYNFLQKTKILHAEFDSIALQVQATNLVLMQAKSKIRLLQSHIQQLIASDTSKNINTRIKQCDTIQHQVIELIVQHHIQDSLTEQNNFQWQQEVRNKNTEISLQQSAYTLLKTEFNTALAQQHYLEKDNLHLFKIAQRKNTSSKILSLGIVVLSSVAATLFLQQHTKIL
jgi:hypothetical protein